jgi:hypothetical protein
MLVDINWRRLVRFLYLLLDEAPRPSEYGMCFGFGWFLLAISDHVLVRVGFDGACVVLEAMEWVLVPSEPSWLVGVGGEGSEAGGMFCTIPM